MEEAIVTVCSELIDTATQALKKASAAYIITSGLAHALNGHITIQQLAVTLSIIKASCEDSAVGSVVDDMYQFLCDKNAAYGNSALDPVNIFSTMTAEEAMRVRIDDKISRLIRGSEYGGDDTVTDLLGYLILMMVNEHMENK